MRIFFIILGVMIIYLLGHITGKYLVMLFNVKKHYNEKHFCNYCEFGFLSDLDKLQYSYCPFCGRPLDYFYKDKRSLSYKAEDCSGNSSGA